MRRSNSSNIPMLSYLQANRESRGKERSKSATRYSRDRSLEGVTPLAHRPFPQCGADKKYSVQKNFLRTPTTPCTSSGFKRSNSLSSFGSKFSVTRSTKSPMDKKTLQRQQYAKIQEFIQTSGLFNPELAEKIRPPTIATFVELVSNLFLQIIKTVPINTQNYPDVVIKTLKLLRYPGQITISTLKTVNTMHGWPNFLAIISWLIERVDLRATYDVFIEQQDEDVKATFNMHDAVFEFLTSTYSMLLSSENIPSEDAKKQHEEQLYADMLRITGTDQETAVKLQDRLESERTEVANLESKLQEIKEANATIEAQNVEKQNVIKKFEEDSGNKEQEIKEEIVQLKKALGKCAEDKAALLVSIKELEDRISKQTCKYKEKSDILCQIDDLKRVIERKEMKLAEYRVVRDDLDLELRTLVTEIESKVDAWNFFITKTFLPELKTLRLREKGFHSDGFLQEIMDIHKEKLKLEEVLLRECKASQTDIENLQKQKESLLEGKKAMMSMKDRSDKLRSSIQLLEEENKKLLSDLDDYKRNHETNIKEIEQSEETRLREQQMIIAELSDKKEKLMNEINRKAQKYLAIIIEAHNMAIENIQEIEKAMVGLIEDAKTKIAGSNKELQAAFEHLLNLRKITAKLYQECNEENKEHIPTVNNA